MQPIIKFKQAPHLRISHQSEVLILRQELAALQAELKVMKKNMNNAAASSRQRKITLSSNGQHHFIALDDILYCEADGNYTKVFIRQGNSTLTSAPLSQRTSAPLSQRTLADFGYRLPADQRKAGSVAAHSQRTILISKTLKSTSDLISSDNFIRCHQSFLVNKKHVTGYLSDNGLALTLNSKISIPVSRRNKKEVLELF